MKLNKGREEKMKSPIISLEHISKYYDNPNKMIIDDFNLVITKGEIITLLGPSGCGKTTLLRLIAGFETQELGTMKINDIVVSSQSSWIPPEKRGIGMVFQDYALFPHLTIKENIKFALNKWGKKEKEERVKEVLELVDLIGFENRFPYELSGGQQQRVALARAIAPKPNLILLDEPFSNLDAELRGQMRKEIKNIIKKSGTTAIFVSHDQKDALGISDRIVIINKGRIEQIGTPIEVYRSPKSTFVAQFLGIKNFVLGNLVTNSVETKIGIFPITEPFFNKESVEAIVAIRAEGITIEPTSPIRGMVKEIQFLGEYIEAIIEIEIVNDNLSLVAHLPLNTDISIDSEVGINIASSAISVILQN